MPGVVTPSSVEAAATASTPVQLGTVAPTYGTTARPLASV